MHLSLIISLLVVSTDATPDPCQTIPTDQVILASEYEGLELTRTWVVEQYLTHGAGKKFDCAIWTQEKIAFENLDIFASVNLTHRAEPSGIVLVYQFVEWPSFVAFPAIKATDQQGWAAGGGVAALSILGTDIRVDFYIRTTIVPDPFSATEFMFYSESPTIGSVP